MQQSIRNNPQKISQLKEFDKHSLLKLPDSAVLDALDSDEYGLLDDDDVDITTLRHVPDAAREAVGLSFASGVKRGPPMSNFNLSSDMCLPFSYMRFVNERNSILDILPFSNIKRVLPSILPSFPRSRWYTLSINTRTPPSSKN